MTTRGTTGSHDAGTPSPWVVRFAPLVERNGRVLDVACGHGRHSAYFAALGCRVTAVDRDAAALETLAGVARVTPIVADIEAGPWPLAGERFDAVIVTNYLLSRAVARAHCRRRRRWSASVRNLRPRQRGLRQAHRIPTILLSPGELLTVLGERLIVVGFEQGVVAADRPAVLQRIAAVGAGRAWPPPLPA